MIRTARTPDLDALLQIENACFHGDRLSRRSFRHLLTRGNAFTLVDEAHGRLRGYVLVLLRAGTSLARLYSIAVDPDARGAGVARALVTAAEREALAREAIFMRLEIRRDNGASRALFRSLDYRPFGVHAHYYDDDTDALRFEKYLAPRVAPRLARVPYYAQTLDFTCGPAALMMAMRALDPQVAFERRLELRLWRESTTIFMTSGHGGCGPEGLALAAHARGFRVSVRRSHAGPLLLDSVRSEEKRKVMRIVHEDFMQAIADAGVAVEHGATTLADLEPAIAGGAIALVLISLFRIHRQRAPHWVAITGLDARYVYLNDPWVDEESGRTPTDCIDLPVPRAEFDRMARYGRAAERAVVLLHTAPIPAETR